MCFCLGKFCQLTLSGNRQIEIRSALHLKSIVRPTCATTSGVCVLETSACEKRNKFKKRERDSSMHTQVLDPTPPEEGARAIVVVKKALEFFSSQSLLSSLDPVFVTLSKKSSLDDEEGRRKIASSCILATKFYLFIALASSSVAFTVAAAAVAVAVGSFFVFFFSSFRVWMEMLALCLSIAKYLCKGIPVRVATLWATFGFQVHGQWLCQQNWWRETTSRIQ